MKHQLAAVALGEEAAVARFYDDNVDGLYSFVFHRVGQDRALAEDVVQETFTRALAELDRFDPERGGVLAWLCTLSRNAIRDHLREHRRGDELTRMWQRIDESLAQVFEALDREPLSDEIIARAETRDLVNATIANLPDRYRTVLEHKYVRGDSVEALARELDVSEDAAKSLLARARRAFRDAFQTHCAAMAEVK